MLYQIDRIRARGVETGYFRFGTGPQPLVILPGLSVRRVRESAAEVANQYRSLAADFTLYVLDRREDLPAEYSFAAMTRDVADALEALGLQEICLFGASQGGMIAMALTLEQPGLVRRLAVGASAARMDAARSAVIEGWVRLARAQDAAGLFDAFAQALYPAAFYDTIRPMLPVVATEATAEDLGRFCILAQATQAFDLLPRLPEIRCPFFSIDAADDAVLGADAGAEIAAAMRDAPLFERQTLSGFGHAAFDTAPDFKERLGAFFRAQRSGCGE